MIEKDIYDYLNGQLTQTPVYMEIPSNPPTDFVLITKTGSGRRDCINSATIAIQSYSKTLFGAASLNETVKEKMFDITDLDSVSSCRLNSDYNFTDITTKRYRYQSVFDLTY